MANRRAEYQRLYEELKLVVADPARSELQSAIRELILEDSDYARGFLEDSLRRALRFISPVVGKRTGREFAIAAEIHSLGGRPVVLLGASFLPKIGDDVPELTALFGEEIYGLARMKGFDWLIEELAVNGRSIADLS